MGISKEQDPFEEWQRIRELQASEGPLAQYEGAVPARPVWFEEVLKNQGKSRRVAVGGHSIHYLQWGERRRPGLLLVHGNGAHARWWSFIAPYLASEYNVAAIDLGGMGDSDHFESYSMEAFAAQQIAVCEDAGMFEAEEPPIIVGHSFGGFVTILTGATYGERLSGVVIVDSPVNPPGAPDRRPSRQARPHRMYPTLEAALARFRLMPPQLCDNHYLIDYVGRHSLREVEGGWTWKFDPHIWRRFSIGETPQRLAEIKCRIGIMRGEKSMLFPHEVGRYMYGLLGHAVPVIEIPEAQHHVMLDQPLAFTTAIRALLTDWNHSHPARPAQG
jgi:pimeloyl-ACP methyl ester carboxylesterase